MLAKYTLAQAKESDGALDQAAALYSQIATTSTVVTPNSANLRLVVYNKQSKKEASDILFNMVSRREPPRTRMESPSRNQQLRAPPPRNF